MKMSDLMSNVKQMAQRPNGDASTKTLDGKPTISN